MRALSYQNLNCCKEICPMYWDRSVLVASARSISVMSFCERRLTQRLVDGTSRIQLTLPPRQVRYQATDHIYAQRTTPSGIQPAAVIAS